MELLNNNKKYLLAVSGGPDSMALLHMCIKQNLNIGVAHVNYRIRLNAYKEMEEVKKYCDKHSIPFYCLNKEYTYKGNFQAFARDYRYDFFLNISKKYEYDMVLIGHNQDDHIETYLMQKERNIEGNVYGISKTSYYKDLKVYRPLLDYTKDELLNYCIDNNVIYFIDESNLSDDYTRNKIRHDIIENLDEYQRKEILKEIKYKNKQKKELNERLEKYTDNNKMNLDFFNKLTLKEKLVFLRLWLNKHVQKDKYSKSFLLEIIKAINSDSNFELNINDKVLVKNYKVCEIVGNKVFSYNFDIMSNRAFKTKIFSVSNIGKTIEGISVKDDEWPITIRNYQPGDSIQLRIGTKKVNRWFIDRKIPVYQRKVWPVVLNNKNKVIMVPGIGCDINHYTIKPNIFVIKCIKFTEVSNASTN
ncbi:MAG: tRNA lysidine(34) synthetase TilS [Erysipelotrichaceae bacterium]|nr:tRNA lysidine(34) synthetase TilS [Erysipelotrichaceae bacterium]